MAPQAAPTFKKAVPFLLLSLAFHLVFLWSIFDIWFVSPVVHVQDRFKAGDHGLAKRVVLIVGDGLRADKLFQTYPSPPFLTSDPLPEPYSDVPHAFALDDTGRTTPAPFLRSLITSGTARWGVSHTRVPTESRPGHVALIGGMYEDVSAVTRGWKNNPVRFDSVFNQSTHAFTFGSPDILPMFKEGATTGRVSAYQYPPSFEDFTADAVGLDTWVLEQFSALLANASSSPELNAKLHQEGNIFFLHLLGLDTTGHSYRPHGPEYHRNIRVVDVVVEEAVGLVERFFKHDKKTAYVFTADHGMSDIGNHGDGHPDNTMTPLVAWGAGIKAGKIAGAGVDETWQLPGPRLDVEQASVATLLSVLAGAPVPANAEGPLPVDYLDASPEYKAKAALAVARQVLATYSAKSSAREARSIAFKPFPEFAELPSATRVESIEGLIAERKHEEALEASKNLFEAALRGSAYFHKYDWWLLQGIVTAGYLGWMAFAFNFLLDKYVVTAPSSSPPPSRSAAAVVGLSVFAIFAARFALEQSPPTYYLYAAFPCYFWSTVFANRARIGTVVSSVLRRRPFASLRDAVLAVAALQAIVEGYTLRTVLCFLLIGMGVVWPLLGMPRTFQAQNRLLIQLWAFACCVTAFFPSLPVEKTEDLTIIILGGLALGGCTLAARWTVVNTLPLSAKEAERHSTERTARFLMREASLTFASCLVTLSSARKLQRKQGLPWSNQLAGWAIIVASVLLLVLHGRPQGQLYSHRMAVLLFAFGPPFVILSASYEAVFYLAFAAALYMWLIIEVRVYSARPSATGLVGEHVRIALFFLVFLHVAFFGVGNVASISSFYLEPVYRLIPVFAPFPMAALLLYKLLIPFVALAATFSILNRHLGLPPFALFIVASTLGDVLTLNFFFRVTDKGSWLEIGSTISHFAISSLLSIFMTGLYLLGEALAEGTLIGGRR